MARGTLIFLLLFISALSGIFIISYARQYSRDLKLSVEFQDRETILLNK